MKKFASLLMTAVMLAAMFTVFAVPASAEKSLDGKVTYTEMMVITDSTVIKSGAKIVIDDDLLVNPGATCKVESGASVTVNEDMTVNGTLTVESGACVTYNGDLFMGATAMFEIGGIFRGTWGRDTQIPSDRLKLLTGVYMEIAFKSQKSANLFITLMKAYGCKLEQTNDSDLPYLVTLGTHTHTFQNGACICGEPCSHDWNNGECTVCGEPCSHDWNNGTCTVCGYQCSHEGTHCTTCGIDFAIVEETAEATPDTTPAIGSILSEGSLTVIVGIAAFVLGLGVMFIIMKKKKPATAGGTDNAGEE